MRKPAMDALTGPVSIKDWSTLAREAPDAWAAHLKERVERCRRDTGQAVLGEAFVGEITPSTGRLGGVPYGLKDLFDLAGYPTRASSVVPCLAELAAGEDCELVEMARELGGSCAMRTQMNEFAYGLSGENPHYGDCPHPHLGNHLSGGSSSGSAYVVGSGLVPLAFGTDTGGSIRVPAAHCGIWGLRTVPGYLAGGCFPLAPSLDTVGWFTRTGEDMLRSIEAWFGIDAPVCPAVLKGAALVPEALVSPETADVTKEFLGRLPLEFQGSLVWLETALPEIREAFNTLQSAEAYAVHASLLEHFSGFYDPKVKERILRGRASTDEAQASARRVQTTVCEWMDDYFSEQDVLLLPAVPGPAVTRKGNEPALRERTLQLTAPASLAGKPTLTIPLAVEGARTVGVQAIFKNLDASALATMVKQCPHS